MVARVLLAVAMVFQKVARVLFCGGYGMLGGCSCIVSGLLWLRLGLSGCCYAVALTSQGGARAWRVAWYGSYSEIN